MNKTHILIFIGAAVAGFFAAPSIAASTTSIPVLSSIYTAAFAKGSGQS